jgi:hypothetical protein
VFDSLYCLKCREYVPLHLRDKHPCSSETIAVVDKEMIGIVDRLYNLGILLRMANYDLNCFDLQLNAYCIKIRIDLNKQLNCEVLGELPAGWYYGWDEETDKICMLGYMDFECYVGVARAKERVNAVVRKFEMFLKRKDPAAVKAMLLLTGV